MITRRIPSRQFRELAFAFGLAVIGLGVSAHAALRAIAARETAIISDTAAQRICGERPRLARRAAIIRPMRMPRRRRAAPAPPPCPICPIPASARFDVSDGTIHPARPFSMARASATDRGRALQCLASAVYYEAASESDDGQRAVAQVVLNRVMHPAFPDTVCGVVYQGSERATGCQFSFACDGAMARLPARKGWDKALRIAGQALAGYVFAPVGLATHYHTYAVTPAWNRQLVMTDAIGAHFFHRWAGYWGTPAAFDQVYRGGEPLPGPHQRPALPVASIAPVTLADAASAAVAPPGTAPAAKTEPVSVAMIQPAYADSGALRSDPAAGNTLPESQVLDRWKDSGKPLR